MKFVMNRTKKECQQCGETFEEKALSPIYECTKCFGKHHE
ncbi:YhfH family protein [Ammoniphilus sp. CFH 90114]|nr:YhfH family protein [Ammoniphilus sp. CFH 90114]RXT15344.1 YhfH family protein [Ammoniphilus sp. CFH 90114]